MLFCRIGYFPAKQYGTPLVCFFSPAGGQKTGAQSNMTHSNKNTRKTTAQHRTADTRRLNRETNEGNEGDAGGATETMIR